jgi:hypothetical protein
MKVDMTRQNSLLTKSHISVYSDPTQEENFGVVDKYTVHDRLKCNFSLNEREYKPIHLLPQSK